MILIKTDGIMAVMESRHSVRQYKDTPIESEKRETLNALISEINTRSGLHIQAIFDDEAAFASSPARYGGFKGVKNYIAIVAGRGRNEEVGYYGEQVVLLAQSLGLNTCWVAMSYSKGKAVVNIDKGETLICVISLGYGVTQGHDRKSKEYAQLTEISGEKPQLFDEGVKACMLAPTAINQQKFKIVCTNGDVTLQKQGVGFYTTLDLGIVKCHFEAVTGISVLKQ